MKKKILTLAVKACYFHDIRSGKKPFEYRLQTEYWSKRLLGRNYDEVEITLGYPKMGDTERRMRFEWRGFNSSLLNHPHFGPDFVMVYAIDVTKRIS